MLQILLGLIFLVVLPVLFLFAAPRCCVDSRDYTDPRVTREIRAIAGLDLGPTVHRASVRTSATTNRENNGETNHAVIRSDVVAVHAMQRPLSPAA